MVEWTCVRRILRCFLHLLSIMVTRMWTHWRLWSVGDVL